MVYKGTHLCRKHPFVGVQLTMAAKWIFVALLVCYLQSTALAGDAASNSSGNTGMAFKEFAIQKGTGSCLAAVAVDFGETTMRYAAAIVLTPFKAVMEFYPKNLVSRAKELVADLAVECDSSLASIQCAKQKAVKAVKQLIGMVQEILQSVLYITVRAVELEILSIGAVLNNLFYHLQGIAYCFSHSQ